MRGCEIMGSALGTAEFSRQALDLCLSLDRLGRHAGRPIVKLLLDLANLIIRRSDVRV